jgi:large subunit ribosomal protein L21
MYAIVDFKGAQFKVEKDLKLKVPFLSDLEIGDSLELDKVLMLKDEDDIIIGQPTVENAKVTAEVISHFKDKKVIVFKKKRRKGYQKKQGHRQNYTEIQIKEIIK